MDIRPIRTTADHDEALREIEHLWGAKPGTTDGDKLEVLVTLVGAYEDEYYPIEPSSPLEMLRYAVTDMGRSQKELAEILGSRSQASDLLKGRRRISLEVAQKIQRSLDDSNPAACAAIRTDTGSVRASHAHVLSPDRTQPRPQPPRGQAIASQSNALPLSVSPNRTPRASDSSGSMPWRRRARPRFSRARAPV